MWFATYLYRNKMVTAEQVLEAAECQMRDRVPIGRLALELKMLTMKQVADVLSAQATERKAFGQISVERGYLQDADLAYLLMVQTDRTRPIDEYLVDMGAISRDELQDAYAAARSAVVSENDRTTIHGRAV